MRRRSRALLALIAVLSLALAACGAASGSDGTDGVASLDGSAESVTTTINDAEAPSDPEEAFALFQDCMADHGIDLSQGAVRFGDGGGVAIQRGDGDSLRSDDDENPGGALDVDPEEFEAAQQECDQHLENVDDGFELTPEQEAALEDARLEFQECMTEHGVEGEFMLGAGGAGFSSSVERREEVDPQSTAEIDPEKLEAATEACREIIEEIPELEGVFNGPGE